MLFNKTHSPVTFSQLQALSLLGFSSSDTIILDIETTGLIPEVCTVFMIGCAVIKDNKLLITQWMSDGPTWKDEADILKSFSDYISTYISIQPHLHILTYNGNRFDLRFLKERFRQCNLNDPLNDPVVLSTDLMTIFKPLKKIYHLKNMKLKTLSDLMNISIHKTPEGKILINRFHDYIKTKDPKILDLLWMHNINDLIQTVGILPLYLTIAIFGDNYKIETVYRDKNKLYIHANANYAAPVPITFFHDELKVKICESHLTFQIAILERGLRYYYTDFKNYVYLQKEDFVIPKAMASFVPISEKSKATKENCYTWFYPDESFLGNPDKLAAYIKMLLTFLIFVG